MRTRYIVAGWVVAAAVAIAASIAAVSVAQGGLLSHPAQPMTDQEVQEELAEGPTPTSPDPTGDPADSGGGEGGGGTPAPSPTDAQPSGQLGSVPDSADSGNPEPGENEAVFPSDGGTVLARCADGMVELVWWVAEQGYSIDDVTPGPTPEAEVEFEGRGGESEFSVTCVDGEPQMSAEGDD